MSDQQGRIGDRERRASAAALLVILGIAALAYWPGLSGAFLFDDYANLTGLASLQAEPGAYAFVQYVFGGNSSELGRPLSLLTFAAQAGSWDQRPADFIAVNIALHLLNGALWYALLSALRRAGAPVPSRQAVLSATALWVLLPLHTATVLYVVQRMAILATTCFLAGALVYVAGRVRAVREPAAGYALMGLGVFIGTVLGTLCKETAAVTPLLLLLLEGTLLRQLARPAGWRTASAILLGLPAAALLAYLLLSLPGFAAGYASRTFTMGERLLTEGRVLFTYLRAAFLPTGGAVRVLYDDLPVSTSWREPWTTALAAAGWAGLVLAAAWCRQRAPVFSFAVGGYLIGHLLESTVIPVEIAFSHRSYLPLLGPSLLLGSAAWQLASSEAARKVRGAILVAGAAYLLLLMADLVQAAVLWGQPLEQAKAWVRQQPGSQRAVLTYGNLLLRDQNLDATFRLYGAAWTRQPDDAVYLLSVFELGCFNADIHPSMAAIDRSVRRYRGPEATIAVGIVGSVATRMERGNCPHQSPRELLAVADAMLESPAFQGKRFLLLYHGAMVLDLLGDKRAALDRIEKALELEPQVPVLQQAALWSVQLGDTGRARRHLRAAENSPRIGARSRWLHRREIAGIRDMIELYESLPDQPPA